VSEKINRKSYANPDAQLTDLSGVRIITFFDNQVQEISRIISEMFEVDEGNSMDRSQILGNDKVGYRSVHFVCSLGDHRKKVREYYGICDLKFEVQIRTVLQHAWAELTHDRSYKFSGKLPEALQRKLNLYAGMLEIIDEAFDEIARSADKYAEQLRITKLSDEKINSISISEFLKRFTAEMNISIDDIRADAMIIEEMERFGLRTIGDLETLLASGVVRALKEAKLRPSGIGFMRITMMYQDLEKYLSIKPSWPSAPLAVYEFLKTKYPDYQIAHIFEKYNKTISEMPDEDFRELISKRRAIILEAKDQHVES
jgi:putative GTP pyrophosphokinase